ncbi:hypothetical protein BKA80DRAFT_107560 [Phyllosticta citrichinensis]
MRRCTASGSGRLRSVNCQKIGQPGGGEFGMRRSAFGRQWDDGGEAMRRWRWRWRCAQQRPTTRSRPQPPISSHLRLEAPSHRHVRRHQLRLPSAMPMTLANSPHPRSTRASWIPLGLWTEVEYKGGPTPPLPRLLRLIFSRPLLLLSTPNADRPRSFLRSG